MTIYKLEILEKSMDTVVKAACELTEEQLAQEVEIWCQAGYRVRISAVTIEKEENWDV